MKIKRVTISFYERGQWEEPVTLNIKHPNSKDEGVSRDSEFANILINKRVGDIITDAPCPKFKIIDILSSNEIDDVEEICDNLEDIKNRSDEDLIKLGESLAEIIQNAISIPNNTDKLCKVIVVAYINKEEIENAITLVSELTKHGLNLSHILEKLTAVKETQGEISISNITDVKVLNHLGGLHIDLGAYEKSKAILERSLSLDSRNNVTLTRLGKLCRKACWYADGEYYYKRAIDLNNRRSGHPYNGLGALHRDQGDLFKAVEYFKEALDIDYTDPFAHKGIGATYMDLKMYDEGLEHFQFAGYSELDFKRLYNQLRASGNIDGASKCFEYILDLASKNSNEDENNSKKTS
ncbi:tetratricopeptide repeat protein [Lottiidibacillus patelloidae]|uniref:tetratricopeptide repeat protein n=1 Tax=Lottiidibacillus patelloidae TaxID=2670334 RepID=UPI0011550746|nr:tetratricopeptide repeat protein [Lottiidibacillus patelloidae]